MGFIKKLGSLFSTKSREVNSTTSSSLSVPEILMLS